MMKTLAALLIGTTASLCSPALATMVVERCDGTVRVRGNDDGVKVHQRDNGTLAVRQRGDDRNLGVRQRCGNNALKARQVGDDTLLRVRQKGDENVAKLRQRGQDTATEVFQQGNVNDVQLRAGRRR